MTLQNDLDELDEALKVLKSQTIDKFGAWFWSLKYSQLIYALAYIISSIYVLTSFYLTFN